MQTFITVQVPTFDEFNKYAFTGYKEVQIKANPDYNDVNEITHWLPGIPAGGIGKEPLKDLITNGVKDVRTFYDGRQNTRMLKGYNVIVNQTN